jgi:hypothetical protein
MTCSLNANFGRWRTSAYSSRIPGETESWIVPSKASASRDEGMPLGDRAAEMIILVS